MFRYLNTREQLKEEQRKNEHLRSVCRDLEDALIELAELVASNEEAIEEVSTDG